LLKEPGGSEPLDDAKVAVTDFAAVIEKAQLPVPVQAPLQPVKVAPRPGVAVSVTDDPLVYVCVQATPQEMPAGALVTVPLPVPASVTVKAGGVEKAAVTDFAAVIVTLQAPLPVQAPLQDVKAPPFAGVVVKATSVPLVKDALQVPGHWMPGGSLVTEPSPVLVTVRVTGCVNVAVTNWWPFIVTWQVPVPLQPPPLQPAKVNPAAGSAFSVTEVFREYVCAQVAPQLMAGELGELLLTVPVPTFVTINRGCATSLPVLVDPNAHQARVSSPCVPRTVTCIWAG
jgi:hypothetical protein